MKHTLHVVAPPHTSTTKAYSSCAYTDKARKFCDVMTSLGHDVILYGGPLNSARVKEHVRLMGKNEQRKMLGSRHYTAVDFVDNEHWTYYCKQAQVAIESRIGPKEFICLSFGWPLRSLIASFPGHMVMEYGIGYQGTATKYRAFESYAWMHSVYAAHKHSAMGVDGIWYDAVIPGFFSEEDFGEINRQPGEYLLFMGRVIERKGIGVAIDVAKGTGRELIVAGHCEGPPPEGCTFLGEVKSDKRRELMSGAYALLAPTHYIEPFGNVVVEAMACGTPVITTDWGAFTETVQQGMTGFRCRSLSEFIHAVDNAGSLDRDEIRKYAYDRYSSSVVGQKFEDYFDRLMTLWGVGWSEKRNAA